MTDRYQIVIAWTEETAEVVEHRRIDLGERPIMRPVTIGCSCTWLLDGDEDDLARAHAYADREGRRVFTFPVGYEDSLIDARVKVLS